MTTAGARIGEISLLTAKERHQLLTQWNATAVDYPRGRCVHELFSEQAQRTPEAIAVVFEDQQLSYAQLEARSNQLAHYLQGLGVGPEVLVGLCVERSLEMIVGLLGILKAGGAYLPLDPGYPSERLAYLMQDAGVLVVLSQATLEQVLPSHWGRVVQLDADWPQVAAQPCTPPVSGVGPDNLAYVIYTSGSTGTPKGTLVRHGGLCNLSQMQAAAFKVHPGNRVVQFARLSFDASISEIVMTFGAGATLCLLPPGVVLAGRELGEALCDLKINVATLPPSSLAVLEEGAYPELHTLVVAGESCPAETAVRWASGRHFINAYGPTETTVCATYGEYAGGASRLSIGRPITNTRVYVLDRRLEPVPIAVVGELYIGGAGLARGYLNRPGLTAERFIADRFADAGSGGRLYRTGDLVRYLADGNLEFVGRVDHQVKVRGHRIELGEIEAVLRGHPSVAQVVVVAREGATYTSHGEGREAEARSDGERAGRAQPDEPGEKRLVAYVTGTQSGPVAPVSELREYLKSRLPEYLLPAAFVVLASLPLTPNGKIDRKALPAPEGRPQVLEYVAPRTPTEEVLCAVWAEVLKLDKVGIEDNFFELGGHSLLATRVIAHIRERLMLEFSVRALFEMPTIGELSDCIEQMPPDFN